MGRRDELIQKYAESLRTKCDVEPDMALLEKVTKACGPAIYRRDGETVSSSDTKELDTIRTNFLVKRLGLPDDEHLMGGIQKAITTIGRDNRSKYRPVVYYLLVKHFGKEDALA